jgi:hypothetical protein
MNERIAAERAYCADDRQGHHAYHDSVLDRGNPSPVTQESG